MEVASSPIRRGLFSLLAIQKRGHSGNPCSLAIKSPTGAKGLHTNSFGLLR
jgi:hypothetical protein